MWTPIRRTRAVHATRSRQVGVAVAVLACVGLAACTAAEAPSPASTAEADTIAPYPPPESGVMDPGTYLATGFPVPFEFTVPDGWETFDGAGVGKDDPDLPDSWNATVLFYPAQYVPTDACAWRGTLVQVDPTAGAFVDAMTAQASTVSTPPGKVVVGDYSGFEFDHAVESDVDITDCDGGRIMHLLGFGAGLQRTLVHRCGRARNLPSGRPERRSRSDRGGPIPRIDGSGADRRGTRRLRLDRVRRTRRVTVGPVLAVSSEGLRLRTGLRQTTTTRREPRL